VVGFPKAASSKCNTAGELDNTPQIRRHKSRTCVTGKEKKSRRQSWRDSNRVRATRPGKKRPVAGKKKSFFKALATIRTVVLLFNLIFVLGFKSLAQDSPPSEYQIKAAFLYNFAKFVEWPTQAMAGTTSPLVIGVLGKNVFGADLERTIHNKTINNHPLQVKEFQSVTEATNCQILFISASEQDRFPKILEELRAASILTVSETDHFIEAGGMINFVIEGNKIRFQINDVAAKAAGLKISSKLLSLALANH
jgi:hypothetical protein